MDGRRHGTAATLLRFDPTRMGGSDRPDKCLDCDSGRDIADECERASRSARSNQLPRQDSSRNPDIGGHDTQGGFLRNWIFSVSNSMPVGNGRPRVFAKASSKSAEPERTHGSKTSRASVFPGRKIRTQLARQTADSVGVDMLGSSPAKHELN